MNANDITLHYEFDYSALTPEQLIVTYPQYASISANGRYILMGNNEHLFHLDLHAPEKKWKRYNFIECNIAVATDNGGIWLSNNAVLRYIDKKGEQTKLWSGIDCKMMWGNDDWLFYLDESEDRRSYYYLKSGQRQKCCMKMKAIHVWKKANCLRMVVRNTKFNRLCVDELDLESGKIRRLDSLKFINRDTDIDRIVFRNDIENCHQYTSWPIANGMRYLSLSTWNLIIDTSGKIVDSSHYIPWSPVYLDGATPVSGCSRDKALIATCLAIGDDYLSTSGFSGFSISLINTYIDRTHVHIITSKWHKIISIDKIQMPDRDALDNILSNTGNTIYFITHYTSRLPLCNAIGENIVSILEDKEKTRIHKDMLLTHSNNIRNYFQDRFHEMTENCHDIESTENQNDIMELVEVLKQFSRIDYLLDTVLSFLKTLLERRRIKDADRSLDLFRFIAPRSLVKQMGEYGLLLHIPLFDHLQSDIATVIKQGVVKHANTFHLSIEQYCQLIDHHRDEHGFIGTLLKRAIDTAPHVLQDAGIIQRITTLLWVNNTINQPFIESLIEENILCQIVNSASDPSELSSLKILCTHDDIDTLTDYLLTIGLAGDHNVVELANRIIEYKSNNHTIPVLHRFICEMNTVGSQQDLKNMVMFFEFTISWRDHYFNLLPEQKTKITDLRSFIATLQEKIANSRKEEQLAITLSLLSALLRTDTPEQDEPAGKNKLSAEARLLSGKQASHAGIIYRLLKQMERLSVHVDDCKSIVEQIRARAKTIPDLEVQDCMSEIYPDSE